MSEKRELNKESKNGIEIIDYTGESYMTAMKYGSWRVAYLNHGNIYKEENFHKLERHMETDEVFMLLEGEAILIIGKDLERIPMEQHKVYNIPKGVWHHIITKSGARIFIVENADTDIINSEYYEIGEKN